MGMVFERQREPERAELDETTVRIELYRADAASRPPHHARAIVSFQTEDGARIREDFPLARLLDAKELELGEQMALKLVEAALDRAGFSGREVPDEEPEEREEARRA